jgi:hypothetical protein
LGYLHYLLHFVGSVHLLNYEKIGSRNKIEKMFFKNLKEAAQIFG